MTSWVVRQLWRKRTGPCSHIWTCEGAGHITSWVRRRCGSRQKPKLQTNPIHSGRNRHTHAPPKPLGSPGPSLTWCGRAPPTHERMAQHALRRSGSAVPMAELYAV
ncbi:unnamed protein product [Arctogadus glacialis]